MAELIFAMAFFSVASLNLVHWWIRGGKFMYIPKAGWLRVIDLVWGIATAIFSVVFLAGRGSVTAYLAIVLGWGIAGFGYSIWSRRYENPLMLRASAR